MENLIFFGFMGAFVLFEFGIFFVKFFKVWRDARKFAFMRYGNGKLMNGQRNRFVRTYIREWREMK